MYRLLMEAVLVLMVHMSMILRSPMGYIISFQTRSFHISSGTDTLIKKMVAELKSNGCEVRKCGI